MNLVIRTYLKKRRYFALILLLAGFNNKNIYSENKNLEENKRIENKNTLPPVKPIEYPLDKILATVYHPEKTTIITESDLRPGLDGIPRQLDEIIFENLIRIDARKLHIDEISEEEIDRLLASIQKMHTLTKEQMIEAFKQSGFTEKEGREELKKGEIVRRMMQFRIKDKMIVDKEDIEHHYEKNPRIIPGSLTISQAFVAYSNNEKDEAALKEQKINVLNRAIKSKDIVYTADWDPAFEIQEDELPEDRTYLKDLPKNSIIKLKETDNGITLLHIVSKKEGTRVPLKECEQEITALLRDEKYAKALKNYKQSLLDSADIKYHDSKHQDIKI